MKKSKFYITVNFNGQPTPQPKIGYIYDSGRNTYGIDNRGTSSAPSWYVTDLCTGLMLFGGWDGFPTRKSAVESITPEVDDAFIKAHRSGKFDNLIKMLYAEVENDSKRPQPEKKPRPIKYRTYRNFVRVMDLIQAKGYGPEEAHRITDRIFTEYETNPAGMPILERVKMIIPNEKTPAETPDKVPNDVAPIENTEKTEKPTTGKLEGFQGVRRETRTVDNFVRFRHKMALTYKKNYSYQNHHRFQGRRYSPPARAV